MGFINLKIDEHFKKFIEDVENEKYISPLEIPLNIWANTSWEILPKKELEDLLFPFLKFTLVRASNTMPVYKDTYKNIKSINSFEDFHSLPILVKDSTQIGIGFRERILNNPYILLPNDIKPNYSVYSSGGTKGVATPTFITPLDKEIESSAFTRTFKHIGFKEGDRILSAYNPTHKGGEIIKESILKLGAIFIPRRTTDNAEDVIKTIKHYNINGLVVAQGPISEGDRQSKGGGTSFLNLIEADHEVIKEMETITLGGYNIIEEVIEWSKSNNKPLGSLMGSSEAIPQGGSVSAPNSTRICQYNNLHLFNSPHHIEIVKEEDGIVLPVKRGETGLLVYTTIAREGTVYIRYAPGDIATVLKYENECDCGIKSSVISNISRIDNPNDIVSTGCCIG